MLLLEKHSESILFEHLSKDADVKKLACLCHVLCYLSYFYVRFTDIVSGLRSAEHTHYKNSTQPFLNHNQ